MLFLASLATLFDNSELKMRINDWTYIPLIQSFLLREQVQDPLNVRFLLIPHQNQMLDELKQQNLAHFFQQMEQLLSFPLRFLLRRLQEFYNQMVDSLVLLEHLQLLVQT